MQRGKRCTDIRYFNELIFWFFYHPDIIEISDAWAWLYETCMLSHTLSTQVILDPFYSRFAPNCICIDAVWCNYSERFARSRSILFKKDGLFWSPRTTPSTFEGNLLSGMAGYASFRMITKQFSKVQAISLIIEYYFVSSEIEAKRAIRLYWCDIAGPSNIYTWCFTECL